MCDVKSHISQKKVSGELSWKDVLLCFITDREQSILVLNVFHFTIVIKSKFKNM
jgi:hypothetical protein